MNGEFRGQPLFNTYIFSIIIELHSISALRGGIKILQFSKLCPSL